MAKKRKSSSSSRSNAGQRQRVPLAPAVSDIINALRSKNNQEAQRELSIDYNYRSKFLHDKRAGDNPTLPERHKGPAGYRTYTIDKAISESLVNILKTGLNMDRKYVRNKDGKLVFAGIETRKGKKKFTIEKKAMGAIRQAGLDFLRKAIMNTLTYQRYHNKGGNTNVTKEDVTYSLAGMRI